MGGACPLLVTLRPPALVTEEVAWLAARFPAHVGLGLAAGSLDADFAIFGLAKDDLAARFATALAEVAGALDGSNAGLLAQDPAVARCAVNPVPVVSAAMSGAADTAHGAPRCRSPVRLAVDAGARPDFGGQRHHDAGGNRPCVLVRRVWMGTPPVAQIDQQVDRYRSYASLGAQAHWQGDQLGERRGRRAAGRGPGGGMGPGRRRRAQPSRPRPRDTDGGGTRPDCRLG